MSEGYTGDKLSEPRTIEESLACVGCKYDLRTQRADGACPECGLAVARTLENFVVDPRVRADGRRFQRGLVMLSASLFVIPVTALPVVAGVQADERGRMGAVLGLAVLVGIEHVLWALGITGATHGSKGGQGDKTVRWARTARWSAWVNLAAALLAGYCMVKAVGDEGGVAAGILGFATAAMLAARTVGLVAGSRRIAATLKPMGLVGRARLLRGFAVAGWICSVAVGISVLMLTLAVTTDIALFEDLTESLLGLLLIPGWIGIHGLAVAGGIYCAVLASQVRGPLGLPAGQS